MRRRWAQLDRDDRDRWIAFFIATLCAGVTADLVGVLVDLNMLSGFAIRVVVLIPAAQLAHMMIQRIRGVRDRATDVPSDHP